MSAFVTMIVAAANVEAACAASGGECAFSCRLTNGAGVTHYAASGRVGDAQIEACRPYCIACDATPGHKPDAVIIGAGLSRILPPPPIPV